MKVRVTSIAWKGVSEGVRFETVEMQNALSTSFKELSFGAGIDQTTIVIKMQRTTDCERVTTRLEE
jgi:hypothetical protein